MLCGVTFVWISKQAPPREMSRKDNVTFVWILDGFWKICYNTIYSIFAHGNEEENKREMRIKRKTEKKSEVSGYEG